MTPYLSVTLFHGPDGDEDPPANPKDPRELPQSPHPPLGSREVVYDRDAQARVVAVVAKRQRQIVTH